MIHYSMKENELNINKLDDYINRLHYDYYEKYGEKPRYIKVPIWVWVLLRENCYRILGYSPKMDENDYDKYRGLLVCPTKSIETTEQIEVF